MIQSNVILNPNFTKVMHLYLTPGEGLLEAEQVTEKKFCGDGIEFTAID